MAIRIGHGYDAHRLAEGRRLILGGVEIPYNKGLLGHSDADALLHAVMDAILGALSLGDIGVHFPDKDPAYRNADSLELLGHVAQLAEKSGYRLSNLDATILAEEPKLAGYIPKMRKNITEVLGVKITQVSVKATTEEGMGFTGSGQGISAHAVVLMESVGNQI